MPKPSQPSPQGKEKLADARAAPARFPAFRHRQRSTLSYHWSPEIVSLDEEGVRIAARRRDPVGCKRNGRLQRVQREKPAIILPGA